MLWEPQVAVSKFSHVHLRRDQASPPHEDVKLESAPKDNRCISRSNFQGKVLSFAHQDLVCQDGLSKFFDIEVAPPPEKNKTFHVVNMTKQKAVCKFLFKFTEFTTSICVYVKVHAQVWIFAVTSIETVDEHSRQQTAECSNPQFYKPRCVIWDKRRFKIDEAENDRGKDMVRTPPEAGAKRDAQMSSLGVSLWQHILRNVSNIVPQCSWRGPKYLQSSPITFPQVRESVTFNSVRYDEHQE